MLAHGVILRNNDGKVLKILLTHRYLIQGVLGGIGDLVLGTEHDQGAVLLGLLVDHLAGKVGDRVDQRIYIAAYNDDLVTIAYNAVVTLAHILDGLKTLRKLGIADKDAVVFGFVFILVALYHLHLDTGSLLDGLDQCLNAGFQKRRVANLPKVVYNLKVGCAILNYGQNGFILRGCLGVLGLLLGGVAGYQHRQEHGCQQKNG